MPIYNKLVRDLIPQIIESSGKKYNTKILDDNTYIEMLNQKLQEELNEYYESQDLIELADLLEVIYAIAKIKGLGGVELERLRERKQKERGGFDEKILLIDVED